MVSDWRAAAQFTPPRLYRRYYTYKADHVLGMRPPSALQALVPDAQTFRAWAEANKDALKAAL